MVSKRMPKTMPQICSAVPIASTKAVVLHQGSAYRTFSAGVGPNTAHSRGLHVVMTARSRRGLGLRGTVSAVLGPNTAHSRGLSAVAHAELGLNYPVVHQVAHIYA